MRYCPTCETKFEEDKIRFCTKDGTELVEGSIPAFTDNLPSDSVPVEDDPGEETIIRRKRPAAPPVSELPEEFDDVEEDSTSSRIVIDTAEKPKERLRTQPPAGLVPPQRTGPGTGVIIFFSVLGTLIVVIGIFAIYLLLTMRAGDANSNVNENLNANVNENLDENFNADDLFNLNSNLDSNSNLNTNINTATPTPSPTPSPTETPETNVNGNVNANTSPGQSPVTTPSPRPTVTTTPSPANVPSNTNRPVNVGTINSRAVSLPLPSYPSSARQVRAAGRVAVSVTLDRNGNVVSATATSGHPLLRGAAEDAALKSRFRPVSINGRTVPARGTILYNFVD